MSIIESIRTYIMECPFLKDGRFNVGYLGYEPCEYTIDSVPASIIIKRYVDGDSLRQFEFIFASREEYNISTVKNMVSSAFYEEFAAWLEKQTADKNLPAMAEGQHPQKIEAVSSGYLFQTGPNTARYQIQCRLTYYQEFYCKEATTYGNTD